MQVERKSGRLGGGGSQQGDVSRLPKVWAGAWQWLASQAWDKDAPGKVQFLMGGVGAESSASAPSG